MRVSQTPKLFACPQSRHEPKVKISGDDVYARLGSAFHEHQAIVVQKSLTSVGDIEAIGKKWNLEPDQIDDLEFLCWRGIAMWQQMSNEIEVIAVEEAMSSFANVLTGTTDLRGLTKGEDKKDILIDWKTGFKRGDEAVQVRGYSALRWLNRVPQSDEPILGMIVFVRDGTIITEELHRDDITQWIERYEEAMHSDDYRPGDCCQYCQRKYECEALQTDTKNSLALFDAAAHELGTPEAMARLYPKTRELKVALERYENALRAVLAQHPEGVPDGAGKILSIEKVTKQEIKGSAIDHIHGIEGWQTACRVSKNALMDLVAEAAPKGKKKEEKEKVMAMLEETGCVETSEYSKITSRKEE